MKTLNPQLIFKRSAIVLALAAFQTGVLAADEEETALTQPTNTLELGVVHTSQDSSKFGEYNGLSKSGPHLIGNILLKGGDGFSNNEKGGIRRWTINGENLGLTNRSLNLSVGDQGDWTLGSKFDELHHNLSDTYQTPYSGAMGGNQFFLNKNTADTTVLSSLPALTTMGIENIRKNSNLFGAKVIDHFWDINFDYNHLEQTGAKLMGFGSAKNGNEKGQGVSILPNPTNSKTDTLNLGLNYRLDDKFFTLAYFGSFYRDKVDRVTFSTYNGANDTQNMSTMPNNNFNQLLLNGGMKVSPKTKLTSSVSYGLNTQSDPFVVDAFSMVNPNLAALPRQSLGGVVETYHADLKLSNQFSNDMNITAGFRLDERNNKTPSSMYNFHSIDGGNDANYPNTPISNKKGSVDLASDYRINKGEYVRVAFNHENIDRWCNNYATGVGYPAGSNCVTAKQSKEDKIDATYRFNDGDGLSYKLGAGYAAKQATFDPNAIAAFIGQLGSYNYTSTFNNTASLYTKGLNGGDFPGFYPFFDASRKQQFVKAGTNWEANQHLTFGVSGKISKDAYNDSTYGVLGGNAFSINLDSAYNYSESGQFNVYLSHQRRSRDMTDYFYSYRAVSSTNPTAYLGGRGSWSNTLTDADDSMGIGFKQANLMAGRLEVSGDYAYTVSTSTYSTVVGSDYVSYASAAAQASNSSTSCSLGSVLSCGALPDIRTVIGQLKLAGVYTVDKETKVSVRYMYSKLNTVDYYYNGLQSGMTPTTLMPTNQQPGNYSINLIALSLIHQFN